MRPQHDQGGRALMGAVMACPGLIAMSLLRGGGMPEVGGGARIHTCIGQGTRHDACCRSVQQETQTDVRVCEATFGCDAVALNASAWVRAKLGTHLMLSGTHMRTRFVCCSACTLHVHASRARFAHFGAWGCDFGDLLCTLGLRRAKWHCKILQGCLAAS